MLNNTLCLNYKICIIIGTFIHFLYTNIYANDPYIQLMQEQANSIHTFEAVFTCNSKLPIESSDNIFLRIDEDAGCWKSKVVTPVLGENGKTNTWIDESGQTSKTTWQALSTLGHENRRIDIYSLEEAMRSKDLMMQTLRVKPFKASYVFPHILLYPSVKDVEIVSSENLQNNRVRLEYIIIIRPGTTRKAIYDVELSDGIMLHEAKIIRDDGSVVYEIINNSHKKCDDIWVAHYIEYRQYNESGTIIQEYVIEVADAKVNTPYNDSDFMIIPKYGDDIRDHIIGNRYRYGHFNNGPEIENIEISESQYLKVENEKSVIDDANERIEDNDRSSHQNIRDEEANIRNKNQSKTLEEPKRLGMNYAVLSILIAFIITGAILRYRKYL